MARGHVTTVLILDLDGAAAAAVRVGPQKPVLRSTLPRSLLFDLAADPDEQRPLPDEAPERAALERRLFGMMARLRSAALPHDVVDVAEPLRQRLEALGYLGEASALLPRGAADLQTSLDLARPTIQLLDGFVPDTDGSWSTGHARFMLPIGTHATAIRLRGRSAGGRVRCRATVEGGEPQELVLGTAVGEWTLPVVPAARRDGFAIVALAASSLVGVPGVAEPVAAHWSGFAVE